MNDSPLSAVHRLFQLCFVSLLFFFVSACAPTNINQSILPTAETYQPGLEFKDNTVAFINENTQIGYLIDGHPVVAVVMATMTTGINTRVARQLMSLAASPSLFLAAKSQNRAASVYHVLKTAFSQIGRPYHYGGTSPHTGFDCSGFVGWVYGQYDIGLPHSSGDMMAHGQSITREKLRPGDLVFFGQKKRVTHVGIYTGNNKYIHSPSRGKGIEETSLDDRASGEHYVGARRILNKAGLTSITTEQKKAWINQAAVQKKVPEMTALKNISLAPVQISTSGSLKVTVGKSIQTVAKAKTFFKIKKHEVKSGDTLYVLARKYGVTTEEMVKVNKLDVKRPTVLKLGQVLLVPGKPKIKTN
ncbi:MAG: hypothetical protein AMR96_04530 [Candidatus Adiutrix intracellularis]|nr:MAG: hypothetical protein AMR96_04530 [Candidatus Adiutrix intracellularis]